MASLLTLLGVAALFFQPSLQQAQDPLVNFCRRFGHQTTVIGNRLYIDGGLTNFNPIAQNPANYSNPLLLYADLTVDNQGMPKEYKNLSKPATAPDVSGGILWADTVNRFFYLYGGEYAPGSPAQSFSMWSYDDLNDKWATLNPDVSQNNIQRASFGAGVVVDDRALGYYYGGWLSNATVPTWGVNPVALSNMLQYDMIHNTWTNSSGPDSIGRAEGIMVYIPASDGGMLVYFGGVQSTSPGNWTGQPMDTIFLYDIANAKWYTQKATGQVPEMRRRFCGGVTWAKDQSSYNIYLYGGASMPPNTVGFDDIYILSMPSFTWIKWYPTAPGTAYPHHSLSCNVINGNQMLVMGGTFPNSTDCDAAPVYGFHNMDLAKNNKDGAMWALFNDTKEGYNVPSEIVNVVGGSGAGGASNKSPKGGFDSSDLGVYFTRVYKVASTRTPTRAIPTATSTPSSKGGKSNKGAIIGGAVGGGIAAIIVATLAVCFCMRRRQGKPDPSAAHPDQKFQNSPIGAPIDQHSPQPSYHPVYPQQPPVQLPTDEHYHPAPVELQGHDVVGAVPMKGYAGALPEKQPLSYAGTSPATSPQPSHAGYFPQGSPAPVYQAAAAQPQTYYPPPGQPHQYSPPPQQHFSTPGSATASSPSGYGFTPSPVNPQGGASPHDFHRR